MKKVQEKKGEILLEDKYEDRGSSDIHAQIIKWFLANPYPDDEKVHKYAEELGMDPDEFEKHIYMVLSSILSEGF